MLDSLYVAYWSLRDPLTQSQVLPVVLALADRGYRMGLMTAEQPRWTLSARERGAEEARLRERGILWIPRRYHKQPRLLATLADVLLGARNARASRPRLLHGRGSVAAAIAYLGSRGADTLFLNDADGPLSVEYLDAGVFRSGSLRYRLTALAEQHFLDTADANAVLTTNRASEVSQPGRVAATVLPCAVDTAFFVPNPAQGRRLRKTLGLEGTVFVYAGNLGGWYLVESMMDFVSGYRALFGACTMLVLTNSDQEPFRTMAAARGIPLVVRSATRDQMPDLLSAADVGLSFVFRTLSKTSCSPVKNGEYLACGLPLVTTQGVGDYSALVARDRVGVVVEGLREPELSAAAHDLHERLHEPQLADRCRRAAVGQVGLREVVLPRYFEIYERLLGPAPGVM